MTVLSLQKYLCLVLITLTNNYSFSQNNSLIISPNKPENGQKVELTYHGRLVKEGTKMYVILQFSNLSLTPTFSINAEIQNNALVGSFVLPDSISFFYIKIANIKDIDNNNGKGFGFQVFKNGCPLKGAYLTEGYFFGLKSFQFNGNVDYNEALKLFEKEYEINPNLKSSTLPAFLDLLSNIPTKKEEATKLAKFKFAEVLESGTNQVNAAKYAFIISEKNFKKHDSLLTLLSNKYPNGFIGNNKKIYSISKFVINKPDTVIKLYEEYIASIPTLTIGQKRRLDMDFLSAQISKCDYKVFDISYEKIRAQDNSKILLITLAEKLRDIGLHFAENKNDLINSKIIIEKAIKLHIKYDSLSTYYGNTLQTYSEVLYKLGHVEDAIFQQKKAVDLQNFLSISSNQSLIQIMSMNSRFLEVLQYSEKMIINNVSNPVIDSLHKSIFLKINLKDSTYFVRKKFLQNKSNEVSKEIIKSQLIKIDAPEFTLVDLKGNKVSLSDFKGKIVILDFWATWCAPCIRSFPSIKKVIAEHSDKPIVFLFINTMEEEMNERKKKENIIKILEKQGVTNFNILIEESKSTNLVANSYNVFSLPSKVIIDKDSKIRYQSFGFGTSENLNLEFKNLIEVLSEM